MAELVQGQSAPVGMKAEGFVDALHRVRQIAAKIDSIPHLNNSTPLVDPSVYGYGVQKRPLDDGGNQLGALVHQRAVITEEFKVPDKMVGFIIGRGGEQISRIQAESGCKIQIASESSGIPERPCVLTGTPESIEQAKRLLGQIVDRCRNGPGFHNDIDGNSTIQEILIPASKVGLVIGKGGETIKQLQERTGVKMVMIQDGPLPTGADKPLRITGDPFKVQQAREMVLEIIREKDQADFRGVRGDFNARVGGGSIEVCLTGRLVSVPRFAVGIVIGRNGEMIKKIQNDAGVRIQFKPDDGVSPERAAQVMGPPDRCQHAAHVINELILTAQERDGFGGLAVARGRGRGRGDWSVGAPGGVQEITYTVPADKCGLVIGKGGENIKSINQQSGAHVELQRNPPPSTDPSLRVFTIRGVPQQIEVARHLIDEKVGGTSLGAPGAFGQSPFSQPPTAPHQHAFPPRSSACFPSIAAKVNGNPPSTPVSGPPAFLTQGWGSTYQAWQQPTQQVPSQQSQPQNSQPDYSKAWEDYYKKQSHAASAAPPASSPPDYTMAWAEYYRQQVAFYGQTLGQAQAHSQEQ
ncbi:far upstream element-binding protein 3 isoform X2 [Leopardus geoffroyi]|uniref:far upstream element-binding protein 3 isoform X2 n=1 Tax=Felis catus TaxID=9685 RepID=UPI001D1A26C2|nr:far upstream element-binding protein 3 isoform X2 [Felis catus]XP_045325935.1 far upstream element-binding protein 3 isoform X2 [Leopardus geoffroyi]XP_058549790.1 far upstream element-binding protein 3 isoform X2 [Neofelis nebulosa]